MNRTAVGRGVLELGDSFVAGRAYDDDFLVASGVVNARGFDCVVYFVEAATAVFTMAIRTSRPGETRCLKY